LDLNEIEIVMIEMITKI